MPAANPNGVTMHDVASRQGADKKIQPIVEVLAKDLPVIDDMVVVEANEGDTHLTTIRSGYPEVTWRKFNKGVQPSKSRTVQVRDTCGMLEARSEIDAELAQKNHNDADWRASEDVAFMESMARTMGTTIFYGNEKVDDDRFTGFAPRFATYSSDPELAGSHIVKCNASASGNDQSSIWLVGWGRTTVHGIYPRGFTAGLEHEDLGEYDARDADGGVFRVVGSRFRWKLGLVVRDWRAVVRIANIDTSALTSDPATGDLFDSLADAVALCKNLNGGNAAFYCSRKVGGFLLKQAQKKATYTLTLDQLKSGEQITRYAGIPIRISDSIVNTEAVVS